jgi:hypothetical protein
MSLLEVLGNAVSDDDFVEALFADPLGTTANYGFQLNNWEREQLVGITRNPQNKQQLMAVKPCPQKPCPWAVSDNSNQAAGSGLKVAGGKGR